MYAQSNDKHMGALKAKGGAWGQAGIGGDSFEARPGSVVVIGGRIDVAGGSGSAGIGGGFEGSCDIEVSGGSIFAEGGIGGAGVGTGGCCPDGGRVSVSGGRVEAYGANGSAGIGGGVGGPCDTEISGGSIFAMGGSHGGSGIGTGYNAWGGSVTISGGDVYAKSRDNFNGWSTAIGVADGDKSGNCTITVTGGKVTAHSVHGFALQTDDVVSKKPSGSVSILGGTVTLDRRGWLWEYPDNGGDHNGYGLAGPGQVHLGDDVRVVSMEGEVLTGADRYGVFGYNKWLWARLETGLPTQDLDNLSGTWGSRDWGLDVADELGEANPSGILPFPWSAYEGETTSGW